MNRIIRELVLATLMMAICASASSREVEHALFEEAVDSLPAELTVFKDLFGPSFIRAIKTVLSDCDALLKKLDASYEPTMDDVRKKYDDAMKVYEDVHPEAPDQATQLQKEMRQLQNFMEGANRAKEEERKKIKKQCELRKQDLLRNRMFAVLTVFREIYRADPDNLLLVTNQLQGFISKLEEGLEKCRKMVNSLNVDDPTSTCDDNAIAEAIEFIKAVLLTLPSQVEKGFPDLPGDTEGETVPLDDGSTPDVFVGDIPNILMPGPVIIDEPPEDDDDTSGLGSVGIPDGSGDSPTTVVTVVTTDATESTVTTESMVTTDATVTTESMATTESMVTTDATVTTESMATTDATVTTDSMATTNSVTTSGSTGTTGVVDDDATVVTDTDIAPTDDDHKITDDVTIVEVATTQPVAVEDVATAKQIVSESDAHNNNNHEEEDDDDDNEGLVPLYIALLVCISLLVVVMVIMIVVVLVLRYKAMQGRSEAVMSEDDKLSLMKEGYVNPTYQFFDKSSTAH